MVESPALSIRANLTRVISILGADVIMETSTSVPYARTQTSVDGESTVAYQRNQAMDPGFAGFDADRASVLQVSLASNSNPTAAGTRKVIGGGKRFTILWTSRVQLGAVRRSSQRSVVSYTSLSRTIQSIQAQGGSILSIANA